VLLSARLVLWAEGLGAVAASTAVTSVFAAARAPIPSARPKRTESIFKSVAVYRSAGAVLAANLSTLQGSQKIEVTAIAHWRIQRVIGKLEGTKRNEELSVDDRRFMRRSSMFYRMGPKTQASGGGACGAPGGSLVGSPYRCISLWRTGLRRIRRRAYSSCSRTCAPQYPQCRSRRSRQAGNTRCAVDCIQRAVRRWH
jgi:hypothetical protein